MLHLMTRSSFRASGSNDALLAERKRRPDRRRRSTPWASIVADVAPESNSLVQGSGRILKPRKITLGHAKPEKTRRTTRCAAFLFLVYVERYS